MQTQPGDLLDEVIATATGDGWGLAGPLTATYTPIGYGSHHWVLRSAAGGPAGAVQRRWFVSVDAVDAGAEQLHRLRAALEAACVARGCGLGFVVAPLRAADGDVLRVIDDRYAIAVYPFLEGTAGAFDDGLSNGDVERLVVHVGALHGIGPINLGGARLDGSTIETLTLPGRGLLTHGPGGTGLFAEAVRSALDRHADGVARALAEHDRLVDAAGPQTDRLVLTHGEPHPGNVLRTPDGSLWLIDWDTAQFAPPERDLWMLDARSDGAASPLYAARTGRRVNQALLRRYALAWELTDVIVYVGELTSATQPTADTDWQWRAFEAALADLDAVPGPGAAEGVSGPGC